MLGRWGLGGRGGRERTDLGLVFGVGAAVLALADLGGATSAVETEGRGGEEGTDLDALLELGEAVARGCCGGLREEDTAEEERRREHQHAVTAVASPVGGQCHHGIHRRGTRGLVLLLMKRGNTTGKHVPREIESRPINT